MLFAWIGFLKVGSEAVPQDVQQQTNDFLQQPFIPIRAVGPLLDQNGRRAAMMMIFEATDRTTAEALVATSPYMRAGLYERFDLYEFRDEIG